MVHVYTFGPVSHAPALDLPIEDFKFQAVANLSRARLTDINTVSRGCLKFGEYNHSQLPGNARSVSVVILPLIVGNLVLMLQMVTKIPSLDDR